MPGLKPGAGDGSVEARMALREAARSQGPPPYPQARGISQAGCLSKEQRPSCPEVKTASSLWLVTP